MQRIKASVEQTVNLGIFLSSQMQPAQVVPWLKAKHYTLKGTTFKAGNVAYVTAGYVQGLADARKQLEQQLMSGELKFTRAKGLHNA
jgi:hypothetical protein